MHPSSSAAAHVYRSRGRPRPFTTSLGPSSGFQPVSSMADAGGHGDVYSQTRPTGAGPHFPESNVGSCSHLELCPNGPLTPLLHCGIAGGRSRAWLSCGWRIVTSVTPGSKTCSITPVPYFEKQQGAFVSPSSLNLDACPCCLTMFADHDLSPRSQVLMSFIQADPERRQFCDPNICNVKALEHPL